uniref:Uncharacterized protein n=1 Tax=Oryza rufipogon TaxID=4529 RepID=A0A0E0PXL3_ORYRU
MHQVNGNGEVTRDYALEPTAMTTVAPFMNPIMLVVAAVAKGGNWWAPQRRRGADPVSLFLSLSIGLPLVACRSREGGGHCSGWWGSRDGSTMSGESTDND